MTAPIFSGLPLMSGYELADAPAAQSRFAPAVDANFARINPYAAAYPDRFKVRRVSGSSLLTFNAAGKWGWFSTAETNVEAWYYGDIRVISFIGKYSGPKVLADSYGNLTADQTIATITSTAFLVGAGQQLCFAGSFSAGTAGFVLADTGALSLVTISEPKGSLDPADWVSFIIAYMVR